MKAMLEGPVGGTIFRLTLPMMVGTSALILFGRVDTYFVAKLGTLELAALSFTFPVTMFVTFLGIGLGIGTSATVARAIGAGTAHEAEHLATASLLLALTIGCVVAVAGWLSADLLFRAMGADAATRPSGG